MMVTLSGLDNVWDMRIKYKKAIQNNYQFSTLCNCIENCASNIPELYQYQSL